LIHPHNGLSLHRSGAIYLEANKTNKTNFHRDEAATELIIIIIVLYQLDSAIVFSATTEERDEPQYQVTYLCSKENNITAIHYNKHFLITPQRFPSIYNK